MGSVFTTLDLVIFFCSVFGAMVVGIFVSRRDGRSSEDYFLAGRKTRWWGVAASIYGSNVSANHLIGMLGAGFAIGFAQSHFELGAIAGLLLLCYGFLPVYRRLGLFTLSDYLGQRYDDRSRLLYAVVIIVIMAFVQMVPGLYIGARSICVLLEGDAVQSVVVDGRSELHVSTGYYAFFVIALAIIAASYTIVGGLRAVIVTDVIQSLLLLAAGLGVAFMTFAEIGGWDAMMELDRQAAVGKMHLYLPSDHPDLPWTGVLSGLIFLHFFYWGTNQFIVQRALSARSDAEARRGIIVAGFLKMLIPFFSIATGIAAFYLFRERMPEREIAQDTAFPELVKMVIPVGFGIVGVIAAGVIGAILSSVDSMMNSAATVFTLDIYKKYINPDADEQKIVSVGRWTIVVSVALAAILAILVLDPNSKANFFLQIVSYQSYLVPGILIAFFMGMFWSRSTPTAGFVTILGGVVFSILVNLVYEWRTETALNTFHRVFFVCLLCVVAHVCVSLVTARVSSKEKLTWAALGGHAPGVFRRLVFLGILTAAIFAALAWLVVGDVLAPAIGGLIAAVWIFLLFFRAAVTYLQREGVDPIGPIAVLGQDRLWAGVLSGLAIFIMFYYR